MYLCVYMYVCSLRKLRKRRASLAVCFGIESFWPNGAYIQQSAEAGPLSDYPEDTFEE